MQPTRRLLTRIESCLKSTMSTGRRLISLIFLEFIALKANDRLKNCRNFDCYFFGIAALDFPSFKIGLYFEETTNFIHDALKNGGKILIHCQVGVSRSATIVLAYLMMKRKMSAIEAVAYVG